MFFFTAKDGTFLYMGKDKFENESLIQWGWPEDVWFHVDNLSSAHVYVRLKPGQTWEDITEETVRDCAQLVKENSIEGCKKASVTVIYTPWANLRKDGSMAAGQVSFHSDRLVKKYIVLEKDKETLRRINKTMTESYPDLAKEREKRDEEERAKLRAEAKAKAKADKELEDERRKDKEARSYDLLFKKDAPASAPAAAASRGKGGKKGGAGKKDPSAVREIEVGSLADDLSGMGIGAGSEDASASTAYEDSFM